MKVTVIPIIVSTLGTIPKNMANINQENVNQRKDQDHIDHNIVEKSSET